MLKQQIEQLEALRLLVTQAPDRVLVQNLNTNILHAARPGDGAHTVCGWYIGMSAQQRSGIRFQATYTGHPYKFMCEKCLMPERMAAHLAVAAVPANDSDSSV